MVMTMLSLLSQCSPNKTRDQIDAEYRAERERDYIRTHVSRGTRADVERNWQAYQKRLDEEGKREEAKLKRMFDGRANPSANTEFR